ncbi:hypothetical protein C8Q75DRAFT_779445 [Abortiporus biennis]|nr:hypothetical protein C8Q75DRAFT_779445 [Abortiporus biennis]
MVDIDVPHRTHWLLDMVDDKLGSRLMKREVKKSRRLRRWESLPVAQLFKQNRPLYICTQCRFSNTYCETCPWCSNLCTTLFESSSVRRRSSAPLLLNDLQKDQLLKLEKRSEKDVSRSSTPTFVNIFDVSITPEPPKEHKEGRRRRHRNAMAYSITVPMGDSHSDDDEVKQRSGIHSICSVISEESSMSGSMHGGTAVHAGDRMIRRKQRMGTLKRKKDSSCSSLRRRALSIASSTPSQNNDNEQTTLPPPLPIPHINDINDNARANNTPSHTHTHTQTVILNSPPRSTPSSPTPTSASSEYFSHIPLGHPSRPLYTAIRKNMSRPSSPVTVNILPTPIPQSTPERRNSTCEPRSSSPIPIQPPRRSLNLPTSTPRRSMDSTVSDYTGAFRSTLFPFTLNPVNSSIGFSLSGETEFRMALERRREAEAEEGRGGRGSPFVPDFKFQERETERMKNSRTSTTLHSRTMSMSGSVKGKVKKFKKGLRDLVAWRL